MKLIYSLALASGISAQVEKGDAGRCDSLVDFLTGHNHYAFPDNTFIKYKTRGAKTFAQISCTRLKRKAKPADKAARKLWEKTLSKQAQKGKFKCDKKGKWKSKNGVPNCASRDQAGAWANHSFKSDFQIKSKETGQCLTFSNDESMAAYNPAEEETGAFPLATWSDCQENSPSQSFTWDINFRLKANGLCLTPLPISYEMHANLDYCDTFAYTDGAGTYLFAVPCGETPAQHQQFKFNSESGTFESQCDHKLSLGKVENQGHKAFLTKDTDTFPSAQIFSGLGLNKQDYN